MSFSPLISELINAFKCLPGVGPKSAQRMAFHILERNKNSGLQLAHTLVEAINKVGRCSECRTLSENKVCEICSNPKRIKSNICIVETPADVAAIEQTAGYKGVYFVLMGHLSPIDGIGPEQLGMDVLEEKLSHGEISEVILATSTTVEGETTAYYVAEITKKLSIETTRIALGMPLGGELEHLDISTLSRALERRSKIFTAT